MRLRLFHRNCSLLQKAGYILGPLTAFVIIVFTTPDPSNPLVGYTAGLASWMAIWWITEAVPLPVTALIRCI